jgi:hypothetical protein
MMTSFECIFLESTLERLATGDARVLCEAAAATGTENKDSVRGVARRKIEANSLAACAAVACRSWKWVAKVGCGGLCDAREIECAEESFARQESPSS